MDDLKQNEEVKEKDEINESEKKMVEEVKNEQNKDTKKKTRFSMKKRIILIVIGVICAIELIFFALIQAGQWSTGHGDEFELKITGSFSFCNEGAGSPVGDADLYPRYIYLGHRNIIVFGAGAVDRVSITKITPNKMTVEFGGETYELMNMK